MSETAAPTPRRQTHATVGRLTKLLAGTAVAATAVFGVAVASGGGKQSTGTTTTDSGTTALDDSSGYDYDYDDGGFDLGPSQGVWSSSQPPAATSGGS